MASWGDDLAAHLDSNSTKISAGTSLFLNVLPDVTTGRCVAVFETPGLPAVEKFSGVLPAMTRPRAQIVVRSTKPSGGSGIGGSSGTRSLAQDMWEICVGITNQSVNSNTYQRVAPLQDPFFLRRDEAGRAVFVFNVEALRSATTNA